MEDRACQILEPDRAEGIFHGRFGFGYGGCGGGGGCGGVSDADRCGMPGLPPGQV